MNDSSRTPGWLTIYGITLVAIVLWGLSYIWSDRLLALDIPVEFIVPVRIFIAGLILLVLNLVQKKDIRIRDKDGAKFLLLALCEPFVYFVCETYGIKFTESPTISALIIALNPVFSVFVGLLFFKEKVTLTNALGMLVCVGGLFMVCWASEEMGPMYVIGIILLFVAVISEVSHITLTRTLSKGYAPSVIVMYQFLIGALLFLPLFFTKGITHFDAKLYFSWEVWYPMLMLSVLCSCLAFSLWAVSIKHLGVAKASVFLAVVPICTALWGFLLGDEFLRPLQWAGLGISCVGLVFAQQTARLKRSRQKNAA